MDKASTTKHAKFLTVFSYIKRHTVPKKKWKNLKIWNIQKNSLGWVYLCLPYVRLNKNIEREIDFACIELTICIIIIISDKFPSPNSWNSPSRQGISFNEVCYVNLFWMLLRFDYLPSSYVGLFSGSVIQSGCFTVSIELILSLCSPLLTHIEPQVFPLRQIL